MINPLMLRAVILRAPQYERAVALLWNEWNRFVVSHPISPTTIALDDAQFATALLDADLVAEAALRDTSAEFLETNQQWLSDEAVVWIKEWTDGRN